MPIPVTIHETDLPGVLIVECRRIDDDRGYFTECYSRKTWGDQSFSADFVQDNLSMSRKGTIRGLHYQIEPHPMGKLVRALSGSIFDVAVDLRKGSPTFGKWVGRELSRENNLAMWVPKGFAHGFLALEDESLVHYKCTEIHTPEAERAIAYNDPEIGIAWPAEPALVSPKDQAAPALREAEYNFAYPDGH